MTDWEGILVVLVERFSRSLKCRYFLIPCQNRGFGQEHNLWCWKFGHSNAL